MKKIHLIRHAKSSWKDTGLSDIERPLSQRGIHASQVMAEHIYQSGCHFNHVFCSPALRAKATIEFINNAISFIDIKWQSISQLYTFNSHHLFNWCATLDESITEIVIVGHNPALTDFCNALSGEDISNIPTCGYVQLNATTPCLWANLSVAVFTLAAFLKPKDYS